MDEIGTRGEYGFDLLTQAGKIRRKNRWGNFEFTHGVFPESASRVRAVIK
jgi:hypothetical protein